MGGFHKSLRENEPKLSVQAVGCSVSVQIRKVPLVELSNVSSELREVLVQDLLPDDI